jgi:hypothetical protein
MCDFVDKIIDANTPKEDFVGNPEKFDAEVADAELIVLQSAGYQ